MGDDKTVGILAYGSLIDEPGPEISEAAIGTKHDVLTPFRIEFARKSNSRGGAPTLVPVAEGGNHVCSRIFLLDTPEDEAANRLWRRETRKVGTGRTYVPPIDVGPNNVVVERLENFAGVDVVIYTRIAGNITPLSAENLARLAIASVGKAKLGLDGISYLIAAKSNGIATALSAEYETEILQQSQCQSLEEALTRLRQQST